MNATSKVNCAILLALIVLLEVVFSAPHYEEKTVDGEKKMRPLWFGPRLGRRKRNPGEDAYREQDQKNQVENLLETLQDTPWAIVAINDGKRHVSSFTPRLGRDNYEDFPYENYPGIEIFERSPWTPRLGRSPALFGPRLGRLTEKM
ncbi:unnamed protein product [Brassicogethes aeneus]|uniref:Uncharacterized protein n=1 Tax=Brassicogethes aeneus TaxID=1431903 RepID=A0A9P0BH44_BRAAE|nr:unnamed protein product [Brassicogethes aeneus]